MCKWQKRAKFGRLLFCGLLSLLLVACEKAPEDSSVLLMPEIYAPAMGSVAINPRGHIILVSFFDYTHPEVRAIYPELMTLVHKNQNIRFIYRILPLLGQDAVIIGKLSIAAQFQDKQVAFRDALLLSQKPLTAEHVLDIALAAGLDINKLEQDADLLLVKNQITENISIAHRLGIERVPAYILALADEHNNVITASLIQGDVSIVELQQLMDELDPEAD